VSLCEQCTDLGQCCTYIELPLDRAFFTADEAKWIELHPGFSVDSDGVASPMDARDSFPRPYTIRWEIPCSALQPDGLCGLYGTPFRPEMCGIWPDKPEEQAPDGCAYLNKELVKQYEAVSVGA
jgi:hypothetical protein